MIMCEVESKKYGHKDQSEVTSTEDRSAAEGFIDGLHELLYRDDRSQYTA